MKEPIFLFDPEKGKKIEINGLSDFINKAWTREVEITSHNEKVFEHRIKKLTSCINLLAKAGDRNSAKSTLAFLGVIGIGFLAKKRFTQHTKYINDLEEKYTNLKNDYDEIFEKVEELEAEIFEMDERLHGTVDKEVDDKEE